MNTILMFLLLWFLIGLVALFWVIYEVHTTENNTPVRDEDWLIRNEPNYLGQGIWIKE